MITMSFIVGSDLMGVRVDGKNLQIRGKSSNYIWINYRDLTQKEQGKVMKKYGKTWEKEYNLAKKLKETMSEEEISLDIKKDLQKSGWRLIKKEWRS